jgi:dethiobiotin synthetase
MDVNVIEVIQRAMNYFILGTDTGVGKTVLSLLFMKYFFLNKENPFYFKPFQTGCTTPQSPDSDARFIYENIRELHGKEPEESVLYCFSQPKAPYFAAKDAGKIVDTKKVHAFISEKQANYKTLIIEAAGGVLVPVTRGCQIIDLIADSKAKPVIAARAGLGTINHTLLTIHALKMKGFEKPAVVFIYRENTDPAMIRENMDAVEEFSGIRVSGTIGRLADFANPPSASLDIIADVVTWFSK